MGVPKRRTLPASPASGALCATDSSRCFSKWRIQDVPVVPSPTSLPVRRKDHAASRPRSTSATPSRCGSAMEMVLQRRWHNNASRPHSTALVSVHDDAFWATTGGGSKWGRTIVPSSDSYTGLDNPIRRQSLLAALGDEIVAVPTPHSAMSSPHAHRDAHCAPDVRVMVSHVHKELSCAGMQHRPLSERQQRRLAIAWQMARLHDEWLALNNAL